LLTSAAKAFGDGTIAVILTGMGSDGSAGAGDVKQVGGTVIIQDPRTASYPQLPRSLSPAMVDFVEDLEAIGPLLYELVTSAREELKRDDAAALRALLEDLHGQHGIDFSDYRTPTVVRRLRRRMLATQQPSIAAYTRYVQRHPEERRLLISSFLIKVTQFFRDIEFFDYLKTQVIPDIVEDARNRNNEIRLWSAGCSTGEEAYSLAISLSEVMGEERDLFQVRIFATDLDADAVEFARRGVYPSSAVGHLDPALVSRYFDSNGSNYRVKKSVRTLLVFGQHNLGERAPFPRIDLLVCRNVLIYFTIELQRRVLQLFAFSLRDGGYLALGKAETTTPLPDYFVAENAHLKVHRRRGDHMVLPTARIQDTAPNMLSRASMSRDPLSGVDQREGVAGMTRESPPQIRSDAVLMLLPMGVVVVDRRYDVQMLNGMARQLLGIHSPAVGDDLIHLIEDLPTEGLRAAVDAALRGEDSPAFTVDVAEPGTDRKCSLEIVCRPGTNDVDSSGNETVIVLISDVTARVEENRRLEQSYEQQREEVERDGAQLKRLIEEQKRLLDSNRELTDINMNLRSSNEAFLAGNEELQSASEEVETLNEELQATNEELETLNEELQATVEELNTTNDDLQARSDELEKLADSLDEEQRASELERLSLSKILISMGDAVVVVDGQGKTLLSNDAYDRRFGDGAWTRQAADDRGIPLSEERMPLRRAALGESFSMQFVQVHGDGRRTYFEANSEPMDADGDGRGGVVVIRDITDRSLRRMQDQFLATASHELRTPLTVVHGYLGMMQRAIDDSNPKLANFVEMALTQTRRMEALIEDLLDVARLQGGGPKLDLKPIDLVETVSTVVQLAQRIAQVQKINFDPPPSPMKVHGDVGRLEQVLLNLLTNAVTYAPQAETIDVRLSRADGMISIEVQDYGPGIPPDDLGQLFAPFFQSDSTLQSVQNGLGLGLFISKELVTAHGGTIGVSSIVGKGTTFTVRLPPLAENIPDESDIDA
jgi:two-component system CheB/CheR fusion protein